MDLYMTSVCFFFLLFFLLFVLIFFDRLGIYIMRVLNPKLLGSALLSHKRINHSLFRNNFENRNWRLPELHRPFAKTGVFLQFTSLRQCAIYRLNLDLHRHSRFGLKSERYLLTSLLLHCIALDLFLSYLLRNRLQFTTG